MTSKTKAFVDTTILADALLKPGNPKSTAATAALKRYATTLLPVYAIKEWKAGIMTHYAYLHDRLVEFKSASQTILRIHSLPETYWRYRKASSLEAIAASFSLLANGPSPTTLDDAELADRMRLAIAGLILRSWKKRRKLTSETVLDLHCYIEAAPSTDENGYMDLNPVKCHLDNECSLADKLRAKPENLVKLRDAIPEASKRTEDSERRRVLRNLIRLKPGEYKLDEEDCRSLGDAIFAFFAPADAEILTTNIKDHEPLAAALNKTAVRP